MVQKKCLVTGGAGFIGSHLTDRLLQLGYYVVVVDDFFSGKRQNLKQHSNHKNLKVIKASICDRQLVRFFRGVDMVFHLAAIPRVQYSIEHPHQTNEVNIRGTLNVFGAAREAGVKRIVYSASSSAYGDQDKLPLVESMAPNPMSPYALQKLVGEYYARLFYKIYNIETVSLRYFNVYGPRQDPSGGYACLIPKSIKLAIQDKSPQIYGDGEQTRDFTYVKDVVEANIMAATVGNQQIFGEVFNIGNSHNLSVNFVVKKIIGSRDIKPKYLPPVIEPKDTLADISKAKKLLDWGPKFKFESGIAETVEWFEGG